MPLEIIILAAGCSSRMNSQLPKVLHCLAGRPLLAHVVATAQALQPRAIHVVVGANADAVRAALPGDGINWVVQDQQLGTGHAVLQAMPTVNADSAVLVLYGDVPLVSMQTLTKLLASVGPATLSLLTATRKDPAGYGRIVRNAAGAIEAIVEDSQASDAQRGITEINTGILAVPAAKLKRWLPLLKAQLSNGEHYLTDIVAMAVQEGINVLAHQPSTPWEVCGVNTRRQLSELERYYQRHQANILIASGVTLADPQRIDIRGDLKAGRDVFIDINCVFIGDVTLADHVVVGPGCVIANTSIDEGSTIHPYSVIEGALISKHCSVGPFARLRLGTTLAEKAKIGDFVETKQASIGVGSKVSHLSYIGDTDIGDHVNVGAGTVTCNYDGANKSSTTIGDGAFIGSNTSLIAPLEIGCNATIGAGSTINRAVEDEQLAVARAPQKTVDGWERPGKK